MGKICQEDKILIKNLRIEKGWSVRKMLQEFPTNIGESVDWIDLLENWHNWLHRPENWQKTILDESVDEWRSRLQRVVEKNGGDVEQRAYLKNAVN